MLASERREILMEELIEREIWVSKLEAKKKRRKGRLVFGRSGRGK